MIAMMMKYGSFEFIVIPFFLCNSLATICTLMNDVFRLFLDKTMVAYLDDIVVFIKNMEDHKKQLVEVIDSRKNK